MKTLTTFVLLLIVSVSFAQTDKELVYAAIEDYVDALYLVQPDRIKKSVHPELMKKGFWKGKDKTEYSYQGIMTFDQLVELAGKWNAKGWLANDAPRKIEIYRIKPPVQSLRPIGELTTFSSRSSMASG